MRGARRAFPPRARGAATAEEATSAASKAAVQSMPIMLADAQRGNPADPRRFSEYPELALDILRVPGVQSLHQNGSPTEAPMQTILITEAQLKTLANRKPQPKVVPAPARRCTARSFPDSEVNKEICGSDLRADGSCDYCRARAFAVLP